MTKANFLFLGSGGSLGIPVVGCKCSVCTSSSPFDKRLRPSGLLTVGNTKILIDAGQDFRTQALKHHVDSIDGVILTHAHHDHTAGIDDLRVLKKAQAPIDCLLSQETYDDLALRYSYIFKRPEESRSFITKFNTHILTNRRGSTTFAGITVRYMSYEQQGMQVLGLRFGPLAYLSDIRIYPETIFEDLNGIEILIVSALRFTPSPMHFSVDEAIAFANKTQASKVFFTHISHDLEHEKTNAYLPPHIRMAYDGLSIDFEMKGN